ncbi:MAG: ribose 5-phosphate isomerase B [Phycisphaerae bacterium]|nr:ribose 5-phosphate isomerase B [Phycisphaerae bacterium]
MNSSPLWIANDHGGYPLKLDLVAWLGEQQIAVRDLGCHSTEIVRYPYYAAAVASRVSAGVGERGILICSTGIGMSVIANRYPNVRASLCTSTYMGRMTREHNDSNILCLGGKITGVFEAVDILHAWLTAVYQGGRHDISLGLIADADRAMKHGEGWLPPESRAILAEVDDQAP